jgi:hypothetical protein
MRKTLKELVYEFEDDQLAKRDDPLAIAYYIYHGRNALLDFLIDRRVFNLLEEVETSTEQQTEHDLRLLQILALAKYSALNLNPLAPTPKKKNVEPERVYS